VKRKNQENTEVFMSEVTTVFQCVNGKNQPGQNLISRNIFRTMCGTAPICDIQRRHLTS